MNSWSVLGNSPAFQSDYLLLWYRFPVTSLTLKILTVELQVASVWLEGV